MNYYNYYTQSLVLYYFSHFVVEMKIRELVKSFLIFFSAQFLIIIVAAAKTSYCKLLKVHQQFIFCLYIHCCLYFYIGRVVVYKMQLVLLVVTVEKLRASKVLISSSSLQLPIMICHLGPLRRKSARRIFFKLFDGRIFFRNGLCCKHCSHTYNNNRVIKSI